MLFPKVSEITTQDVIFVNATDSIEDALKMMIDNDHRRIIVKAKDKYAQFTSNDSKYQ